jgi:hypothetical protein
LRSHIEALKRTFDRSSDNREREALAFFLAECYEALDAEKESIPFLRLAVDEGSQSEFIAKKFVAALTDASEFEGAWRFGSQWIQNHPKHRYVLGPTGVAALGSSRIQEGLDLVNQYLNLGMCKHCTETVLRRAINAITTQDVDMETERLLWKKLIGRDSVEPTMEQVHATFQVLTETKLSKIPVRSLLDAASAWEDLSKAPPWLLGKAICGLSHRPSNAETASQFIIALGRRDQKPLSSFAVDHLVEILPELRRRKESSSSAMSSYVSAMELVRKRTTPDSLGKAFRFMAPHIVKRLPSETSDLLELYREWQQQGLLIEPITPYSEIISILDSESPILMLQSLHPEVRDAVTLVLHALRKQRPSITERDIPLQSLPV